VEEKKAELELVGRLEPEIAGRLWREGRDEKWARHEGEERYWAQWRFL